MVPNWATCGGFVPSSFVGGAAFHGWRMLSWQPLGSKRYPCPAAFEGER